MRLLKPAEVAERLQVSKRTVHQLVHDGRLPGAVVIGHQVRIDEAALTTWLAAGGHRGAANGPEPPR